MSTSETPPASLKEDEFRIERVVRRVALVMLAGILLYGGFVLYVGLADIAARFGTFRFLALAGASGLSLVNYLIRFVKWEYYLAIVGIRGIPKVESLLTFLSGFVLTVSPGKVGEVFKSLILYRTRGIPIEQSAPIVVAERITDLIGVIGMIAIGSLAFDGGLGWALAGTLLVFVLLVTIASPRMSARLLALPSRLPGPLGRIGTRLAPRLAVALGEVRNLTTPARLIVPTILSLVGWSLEGVGLWLVLGGFQETVSVGLASFTYATATLAGAIVPVPGGLGVTDKLIQQQLVTLGGVGPAVATAAMLLIRLATLWFAVLIGFLALGLLRLRLPSLQLTRGE
ncbi:MAG: flippase-like domain-containing protein [Myxococcales bacterium]|nr:flippase-like domain-containing protein [Myxococcales bacterium]